MINSITAAALLRLADQYGVPDVQSLAKLAHRRRWEWRPMSPDGERISEHDAPEKREPA